MSLALTEHKKLLNYSQNKCYKGEAQPTVRTHNKETLPVSPQYLQTVTFKLALSWFVNRTGNEQKQWWEHFWQWTKAMQRSWERKTVSGIWGTEQGPKCLRIQWVGATNKDEATRYKKTREVQIVSILSILFNFNSNACHQLKGSNREVKGSD